MLDSREEIVNMYNYFLSLDVNQKGYVNKEDMLNINEINKNPLEFYILNYLLKESDKKDEISFTLFMYLIEAYTSDDDNVKIKILFDICDVDHDGLININEYSLLLKYLIGDYINKDEITELINQTFYDFSNGNKFISYDKFIQIFKFI